MRKFVAIDSHIFIWGIKKQASTGQESKVLKAAAFFDYLWDEGYSVLIPTPVLGEVLAPVPIEDHPTILSKINRRMVMGPYDTQAAAMFAHMFHQFKNDNELLDYKKLHLIPRERVKIDYMIVAIALTNNAECIYSEDPHIKKFAGSFIEVKEIPNVAYQTEIDFSNRNGEEENQQTPKITPQS